jgi:hypothetical protein
VRNNTKGELRIHDESLQFQRDGSTAAQVSISSIQDISLGTEDKQIGGVPMTLGKAAVPFEGGRAISVFSRKKYDTLSVEYFDKNGGFHGAIFEMNQGQGESLKKDLVAKGAHVASPELRATQSTSEVNTPEVKQ